MIINLPKDLEKETTHRYGPNSFKLHRWACSGVSGCGPLKRRMRAGAALGGWVDKGLFVSAKHRGLVLACAVP